MSPPLGTASRPSPPGQRRSGERQNDIPNESSRLMADTEKATDFLRGHLKTAIHLPSPVAREEGAAGGAYHYLRPLRHCWDDDPR